MANTIVTLEIPEADVARCKAAAEALTGLPKTATPKELLAALVKRDVIAWEREIHGFSPPGICWLFTMNWTWRGNRCGSGRMVRMAGTTGFNR